MDYLVVIVGAGILIAVIIVACICFPPYRSEEEWERIDKEMRAKDEEDKRKRSAERKMEKEEEPMMMGDGEAMAME